MSFFNDIDKFHSVISEVLEVRAKLFSSVRFSSVYTLSEDQLDEFLSYTSRLHPDILRDTALFSKKTYSEILDELKLGIRLPSLRLEILYLLTSLDSQETKKIRQDYARLCAEAFESLNSRAICYKFLCTESEIFLGLDEALKRVSTLTGCVAYLFSWIKSFSLDIVSAADNTPISFDDDECDQVDPSVLFSDLRSTAEEHISALKKLEKMSTSRHSAFYKISSILKEIHTDSERFYINGQYVKVIERFEEAEELLEIFYSTSDTPTRAKREALRILG